MFSHSQTSSLSISDSSLSNSQPVTGILALYTLALKSSCYDPSTVTFTVGENTVSLLTQLKTEMELEKEHISCKFCFDLLKGSLSHKKKSVLHPDVLWRYKGEAKVLKMSRCPEVADIILCLQWDIISFKAVLRLYITLNYSLSSLDVRAEQCMGASVWLWNSWYHKGATERLNIVLFFMQSAVGLWLTITSTPWVCLLCVWVVSGSTTTSPTSSSGLSNMSSFDMETLRASVSETCYDKM